jgi:hypothetical protein
MQFLTADPPNVSEAHCQGLLAEWFARAELHADFPLTTDLAVELLQHGGQYDIDIDGFHELQRLGQVPKIEHWDARDLIAAAGALEGRRQWMFTPSIHDPKKTATQLALESHLKSWDEGGRDIVAKQLSGFDLRFALLLITEAENRELREKLLNTIQALLLLQGVRC